MTTKLRRIFGEVVLAQADDSGPKWNTCLIAKKMFRSDFPDGLELTRDDLQTMVANWRAEGSPQLKVDYCHFGSSSDPMPIDQKKASGWIVDLRVAKDDKGRDVLDGLIEWTDLARQYIKNREFSCLSPEWAMDSMNRSTGNSQGPTFFGAGLLNDPFLTDLPRVAASEAPTTHANPTTEAAPAKGDTMDKKLLCAALELPESADETAISAALDACVKAAKAAKSDAVKMSAADEKLKFAMGELSSLRAENEKLKADQLEAELKAFRDRCIEKHKVQASKVDGLVKMARKNGVAETEAFVSEFVPAVVTTTEKGVSGKPEEKADPAEVRRKFSALVDAERAKGLNTMDATRIVRMANPELARQLA